MRLMELNTNWSLSETCNFHSELLNSLSEVSLTFLFYERIGIAQAYDEVEVCCEIEMLRAFYR